MSLEELANETLWKISLITDVHCQNTYVRDLIAKALDLAVQETRQEVRSALADLIFDWQEIADTRRCGTLLLSEREGQIYSACADRLRDMVDELAASLQAGVPQRTTEKK